MKNFVKYLLTVISGCGIGYSQVSYNNCSQALEICPNEVFTLNNINSNVTFCPDCEDDFVFCFSTDNSIWLNFTTNNSGGDVQIDFSSLVFETNPNQDNELQATIIESVVPCDASTYTQIGSCHSNETANFTLTASGLTANTTYYVVIDGDKNGVGITTAAECTFNLVLSGSGVDRPLPDITVSASDTNICLNEEVVFTANLTDCPDNSSFYWYINGTLKSISPAPSFVSTELQQGDVVTVKTSCFLICNDTIEDSIQNINVFSFDVNAGDDVTINPGETVVLNGSTSATTYYWSPSFLVSNPNSLSPIASPAETILFSLTAIENDCTLHDEVLITVTDNMLVPNTFSPNGDGENDTWLIEGIEEKYSNNFVKIFDRWGQIIFQTSGYSEQKAWDGTIKSGKASEGVYFYSIELKDAENTILKGSLTLIR